MISTIAITTAPINYQRLVEEVRTPAAGAVVLFLGTVRELTAGKQTLSLVYEAYTEMAQKQMAAIAEEAATRWPIAKLAAVHRIGPLGLGEVAVAVALSTPHRAAAYEANTWIMEAIKARVPIWKQEHWADGTTEWQHPSS